MTRLQEVLENRGQNYIFPFFWLHGESEDVLREYMNAIHRSNIGAVCLESRPHPDFCGPKWWEDLSIIIDEAKKLDMKVWILDDSHFPTGYANGSVEHAPNELTHQYMVKRTLEMSGPVQSAEFLLEDYMKEAPLPPWMPPKPASKRVFNDDELITVLACPICEGETLGSAIDLTPCICDDGYVRFDLPSGYWRIYVIYLTRKASGRNDYINFMDEESCRLLLDAVYEPHYKHFQDEFGKTILGFFSDEPPIGNTEGYIPAGPIGSPDQNLPWSRRAAAGLSREFGSDHWKAFLPLLWADGANVYDQAKIRSAYMNMVTRLVQECFSEQNGNWCREHGVSYIGHMLEDCDMNSDLGISMGHFYRGLFGQDMAGIDNIGGQVMISGKDTTRHPNSTCVDEAGFYTYTMAKLGTSLAALDPKKKGRCLCENMGAYGWQSGTREQKYLMDHFMVRGVNHYVPHAFSAAPFPDPDCPPHFYAHGENPLYRPFGELMAYANRVCHLISEGRAVPDVALLYNGESKWAGGGDSNIPTTRALTCGQVDYHIIPSDVFRGDGEYPFAFDGRILKVNEISYGALLISGCDFLEKCTADFIIRAAETGYPVIWLDRRPIGVADGTETDNGLLKAVAEGQICVPTTQVAQAVRDVLKPQVSISPANSSITTYHYAADADYYLLLNEDPGQSYSGNIRIRSTGSCFVYDPWLNRITRGKELRDGKDGTDNDPDETILKITIDPLQLLILVAEPKDEKFETMVENESIDTSNHVGHAVTEELKSLTVCKIAARDYLFRKNEAIREAEHRKVTAPYRGMQLWDPFFSGYYIYETEFPAEAGHDMILTIDQAGEAVEVFINDTSLGWRLQPPFRFHIPGKSVDAKNKLRIEVATLVERRVKALGGDISCMSNPRPLSANGIIGQVKIQRYETC